MSKIEVVGLGALNIDHIYKVERILEDGETTALDAGSYPGGSAANTIYGLAKLGVKAGFCGVVGEDDNGKTVLRNFQKMGVDTSRIRKRDGTKTGSVLCLSDKRGHRSLYVLSGANSQLAINDLDLDYINRAGMLHLSSFADERQFKLVLKLVEKLESSVRLSFTPGALYASKGLKTLAPILRRTYILFLNQNEMRQLTGKNVISGAASCLKQGCQRVVVTLGTGQKLGKTLAVGYIRDGEQEYIIKPASRNTRSSLDTTGAGDAFAAGFLYGLLKRKKPKECGRLGNIVAQFCISKIGAREGLPTRNQLVQRYQELYNKKL